mgnify:FL=1
MFKALVLNQADGHTTAAIETLDESRLPAGDVTVAVEYSTINYKDGLALTNAIKIVQQYPMVPGIDFAGTVIESAHPRYRSGDKVILTGWGVGEKHWGGLAEKARVNGDWLVPLPAALSTRQAMIIGTAGFTAMLCVQALADQHITPERGEILVTGASGGVGSVAITLLNKLGYRVAAVTGRPEQNGDLLRSLGATRIIERAELAQPAKPLESTRWAGAVDTVGSQILAKVLAQTEYDGAVAACGLAGGMDLPTTVMPFILRNVKLIGVDSVYCPYEKRVAAGQQVSDLLPESSYAAASNEIALEAVPEAAAQIIRGEITGRTLVKL